MGVTLALSSTPNVPLVPGMETELTLVVVQLSVDDPPLVIVDGEALKESIAHGFTVTLAVAVSGVVPSSPLHLSV